MLLAARRRRRWPWYLVTAAVVLGAVVLQRHLASIGGGWAWRPDLLAGLALHAAWRLGWRGALFAACGVTLVASATSIEPPLITLIGAATLVVAARLLARWLDVDYWFIQPVAALPALVAAEAFVALNMLLQFGRATWAPVSSLLMTCVAVAVLHWPFEVARERLKRAE